MTITIPHWLLIDGGLVLIGVIVGVGVVFALLAYAFRNWSPF